MRLAGKVDPEALALLSSHVYDEGMERKNPEPEVHPVTRETNADMKDADTCTLIGAGIGVLGIAGAFAAGAVCPVCVVAAPGLIGAGLIKRLRVMARRRRRSPQASK